MLYVSFDVDSMDPSVSTGTGTPVENGLFSIEVKEILKTLTSFNKTLCLEFSEINPTLDTKNSMGEVVFDILKAVCRVVDIRK